MRAVAPESFVLETFNDGGLLLELHSGVLFRLNTAAAFVWQQALSGVDQGDIVTAFAESFNVSRTVAKNDVETALDSLRDDAEPPPQTETRYELVDDNYLFSVQGEPVLEIGTAGRSLRMLKDSTAADLYVDLKTVSPKLLALLGVSVLHASAVRHLDGGVSAFLGESGAGKTTTARALAAAGASLICEDKLILRRESDRMTAVLGGESQIERWLREAIDRIRVQRMGQWCDLGPLRDAANGPTAALNEIVLLDVTRRRGTAIDLQPIGPSAGAAEIFQHAFYGSFDRTQWSGHVNVAATLARTTPVLLATMPEGRDRLSQAAHDYR